MKTPHPLKQYIDAFTAGEKVECRIEREPWCEIVALHAFESRLFEFRIVPRTMKLGNREVPVPAIGYMSMTYSIALDASRGIRFVSEEDRAEFWDALVELVKENQA